MENKLSPQPAIIPQQIIYTLAVAIVEGTLAALLLTVMGISGSWGAVIGAVLAGALANWFAMRWSPPEHQRRMLIISGLVVALWVTKAQVGGGYSPLMGWEALQESFFPTDGSFDGRSHLFLLVALYSFWRGSRIADHDSVSLSQLFARGTAALMVIVGVGMLVNKSSSMYTLVVVQILTFFAVALLSIALAHDRDENEGLERPIGTRALLMLGGSIVFVLASGFVLMSLFGSELFGVAQTAMRVLAVLATLIMTPVILVLGGLITWFMQFIDVERARVLAEMLQQQQAEQQTMLIEQQGSFMPGWAQMPLQIICALVPVLLVLMLFFLFRRRTPHPKGQSEERESLLSWRGLTSDLRDLFGKLRNPFGPATGLHAALSRLRGTDPVTRIRRSYIQLLLIGEAREQPRTPQQTPHEYTSTAQQLFPKTSDLVAALTATYERARYAPSSVSTSDADTAEQIWSRLQDEQQ